MYTQGYITEAEFNAAKAETVTLTEKTSTTENATRSSSNSWFTDALYTQLLSQLQEDLNYTADEAKELIFSGGLRIYSTVDPTVQAGIEKTMYNEDDLYPRTVARGACLPARLSRRQQQLGRGPVRRGHRPAHHEGRLRRLRAGGYPRLRR